MFCDESMAKRSVSNVFGLEVALKALYNPFFSWEIFKADLALQLTAVGLIYKTQVILMRKQVLDVRRPGIDHIGQRHNSRGAQALLGAKGFEEFLLLRLVIHDDP